MPSHPSLTSPDNQPTGCTTCATAPSMPVPGWHPVEHLSVWQCLAKSDDVLTVCAGTCQTAATDAPYQPYAPSVQPVSEGHVRLLPPDCCQYTVPAAGCCLHTAVKHLVCALRWHSDLSLTTCLHHSPRGCLRILPSLGVTRLLLYSISQVT